MKIHSCCGSTDDRSSASISGQTNASIPRYCKLSTLFRAKTYNRVNAGSLNDLNAHSDPGHQQGCHPAAEKKPPLRIYTVCKVLQPVRGEPIADGQRNNNSDQHHACEIAGQHIDNGKLAAAQDLPDAALLRAPFSRKHGQAKKPQA